MNNSSLSRSARRRVFTVIFCASLGLSMNAHAQDWWSKAKNVLNSGTGQQVMDALGTSSSSALGLSNSEISAGLKEALTLGTKQVVNQLGAQNGFNLDPKIHIPLPGPLARVDSALSSIGMSSLTDDLELRINRAAEAATPKAKELFISAISQMTLDDAKSILTGPQDAATQFLRRAMGPELETAMRPYVQSALAQAGALRAYDSVMGQYGQIPFMPDVKANLNDYAVDKTMNGIFYYVGQEEAAIRTNPAARTTDLLKKVFANR